MKQAQILLGLAMTIFGFGATFVLFTYLSPILTTISEHADQSIAWLLFVYDVSVTIGNMVGGKLADRYVPAARSLASALNIAGFNVDISFGSTLGSFVIAQGDYLDTAWVGAIMAFIAFLLSVLSSKVKTSN